MYSHDIVEITDSAEVHALPRSASRDKTSDKDSLHLEQGRALGRPNTTPATEQIESKDVPQQLAEDRNDEPEIQAPPADLAAGVAIRLNTSPLPRSPKSQGAPYEVPEGWRSWEEFTRYSEDVPT